MNGYTTFHLPVNQLVDIWVVCTFLAIVVLLRTFVLKFLCGHTCLLIIGTCFCTSSQVKSLSIIFYPPFTLLISLHSTHCSHHPIVWAHEFFLSFFFPLNLSARSMPIFSYIIAPLLLQPSLIQELPLQGPVTCLKNI